MNAATDYITSMPRDEQERRRCIRTYTGRYVNPLQLGESDIDILDIAHHLSNICRYTGACPENYSVGQHSIIVAGKMWRRYRLPVAAMAGLLHDAGEAYFNDIASPVKRDPRMKWFADLEHTATEMIAAKYIGDGAAKYWLPLTKVFDDECFHEEASSWWGDVADNERIVPLPQKVVRREFLNMFNELTVELS